jgi:hypothetical protein
MRWLSPVRTLQYGRGCGEKRAAKPPAQPEKKRHDIAALTS